MTLLIQPTPTLGQSLVKGTVKPYLNPSVFEHSEEFLLRSPNFT
jgi:hypothetical protein